MSGHLKIVTGDITTLKVDAIVNAANSSLLGGGGVDGAIHAAAGPELVVASRPLAPCPAGEARITSGFRLPAKYVIHAVGPIYRDGKSGEAETLRQTYASVLSIASKSQLQSIAFPCISTGAFMFPPQRACEIAVDVVAKWQSKNEYPSMVIFCCFNDSDTSIYADRLNDLGLSNQ